LILVWLRLAPELSYDKSLQESSTVGFKVVARIQVITAVFLRIKFFWDIKMCLWVTGSLLSSKRR